MTESPTIWMQKQISGDYDPITLLVLEKQYTPHGSKSNCHNPALYVVKIGHNGGDCHAELVEAWRIVGRFTLRQAHGDRRGRGGSSSTAC